MKFLNLSIAVTILVTTFAGLRAYAEETSFSGETVATVDVQTYNAVTTYIYGDAAKAIFTATAAMGRIETISNVMRRVVGRSLTCYEKFPDAGSTDPILYTCKFIVQQGGLVVRPE